MSIKLKVCDVEHDNDDFFLGLVLEDQLLFNLIFMPDELRLEPSIKQKLMFLDNSDNIIMCTGRHVGKSVGLKGRIMRDIATYIPEENSNMLYQILLVAPSEVHLKPLIDEMYDTINRVPFLASLTTSMQKGTTAQIDTKTNLRMFGRIEGMTTDSDRNMVGIHPYKIYGDELAFGSQFTHRSRVGGAQPGCKMIYAGVPSGVRTSPLYIYDQTRAGAEWSHHRLTLVKDNPQFTNDPKALKKKIDDSGGENSQDYKTQILGEWGDEMATTFPKDIQSWDKSEPQDKYFISSVSSGLIRAAVKDPSGMPSAIRIPSVDCERAIIGYDYGFSQDPTTFLCAIKQKGSDIWRTYCRLSLWNVLPEDQIEVLKYLVRTVFNYKVSMVSVDNATIQSLMMNDVNIQYFNGKVKATAQGTAVEMDSITGLPVDDPRSDPMEVEKHRAEGKIIKDRKKYWLTEMFKKYMYRYNMNATDVDGKQMVCLKLGRDPELEDEMLSTSESRGGQRGNQTVYHVPKMKHGSRIDLDQNVDAARALTDCLVEVERSENLLPAMNFTELIKSMGFAGKNRAGEEWTPAWS